MPEPNADPSSDANSDSICFGGTKGTVNALNTHNSSLKTPIFSMPKENFNAITVVHNELLPYLPDSNLHFFVK